MAVAYRLAGEHDRRFVVYSLVKALKFEYTSGPIQMEDWREIMTSQLAKILSRPGVEVWVAYCPAETDHVADLYGWLAVEHGHRLPLVHFMFVKASYRGEGFARGLCAAAGFDPARPLLHTCMTATVRSMRKAGKIPNARWNPLIARHPKDQTNGGPQDHGQNRRKASTQAERRT